MPAADFSILLSHSPDQFRWGTSEGADLIFSGHNHGGQVRLPVVGPVLMPSLYGRRYDRGFFQRKGTLLYSNQGVGAKHPLRWNCLPEVALFELRAARRPVSRSGEAPRFLDDRLSSAV
jgi:predicted MPP superfamily phosphohydrolase